MLMFNVVYEVIDTCPEFASSQSCQMC